ncbi:MAG: hypothetical protein H7177_02530 [Rhizobacter sp.]|nr:hypothetical protein [Bacteriovorax sp.]
MADRDYPPLFFLKHEGQSQWLIRKAIERHGDTVTFEPVPWKRCLNGLRTGKFSAAFPVASNSNFLSVYAFPLVAGKVDSKRKLAHVNHMIMRKKLSKTYWDGKKFTKPSSPNILTPSGIVINMKSLADLGIVGSESAQHEDQIFRMLSLGRADLAIIQQSIAEDLLQKDEFKNKLEILPIPFISFDLYLVFSKSFYKKESVFSEAIWNELKLLRSSPEWKKLSPTLAH